MRLLILLPALSLSLIACEDTTVVPPEQGRQDARSALAPLSETQRWYTREQAAAGEPLFQQHCATCHGPDAAGTPNWREPGPDGKYPPPPLNGTAHAWHHPLKILRQSVRIGGVPLGGSMPAFGDKLDAAQIDAILAWVQSHWNDEIYALWVKRDAQSN